MAFKELLIAFATMGNKNCAHGHICLIDLAMLNLSCLVTRISTWLCVNEMRADPSAIHFRQRPIFFIVASSKSILKSRSKTKKSLGQNRAKRGLPKCRDIVKPGLSQMNDV